MNDFENYTLNDLFKIRDALVMLTDYGFLSRDISPDLGLLSAINEELKHRAVMQYAKHAREV